MKIEIFYTPGCSACLDQQAELRAAAHATVKHIEWREINVLDSLGQAVELGIMTLPSIVIDGELAFTKMPTVAQLAKALVERTQRRA